MSDRLQAVVSRLRADVDSAPVERAAFERLAFMVDYEHFLTFGAAITGATWQLGPVGPTCPELAEGANGTPEVEAGALSPEEALTVERVMARWVDDPAALERWLREDEFLAQFSEGEAIDFARFTDPLADPATQAAVMSDRDLHASVSRARARTRPRGAQREGIAR